MATHAPITGAPVCAPVIYRPFSAHASAIFKVLADLEQAQQDADKASVYCPGDDYERCHRDLKAALFQARNAMWNAGLDPDVLSRAMEASA